MTQAKLHNTDHFTKDQLRRLQESANHQETVIGRFFLYRHPKGFTPSEVHAKTFDWPITSTRRAISNLTSEGILVQTDETRTGPYGKAEHVWKWKLPQPDSQPGLFPQPQKSRAYDR